MNRLQTACIALLVCCEHALGQASSQAEDPHLQHAVELLHQQQFAPALPELEQAQRAHPHVAEIENLLGITTTQLGQLQAADAHYQRAIELNAKLAGPHKNLGFNKLNEKAYPLAESELKAALALDPHDSFTHYYLVLLYLATSRRREAVEELEPSRTLLANDPESEFLLAKACIDTGHSAEALTLIKRLEDESQLSVSQNYELALLLTGKQLYSEAALRFEYALARQPQSWIVKYDLAVAYLNARRSDAALQILKPLGTEQPENAPVLTSLGSAYEAEGHLPQALEAYRSAVRADPQNPVRYLDYTRLLMDLDRNDEAMKVVEGAIPNTTDAYALDVRLGVLRTRQGRLEEARAAFNQAIDLHPEIVLGYVALAQSFMQQGSDDEALQPLLRARAALPPDSALEYYVGLVSLRLDHYADAEDALKNSIRLLPDVVESHYQLGKLYVETNRLPDAQSEFEQVLALAPANSNAHYQLSKIYARLGNTQKAAQMASETRLLMQSQRNAALRLQKDRLSEFQPPDPR